MNPQTLQFLQKDYELKIRYLSDHYTRMWNRCNFFVALHSALAVALLGWFKDKGVFSPGATPIAVIGIFASLIWYAFGAQDRYLAELYRAQVKIIGRRLSAEFELTELFRGNKSDLVPYTHVGDTEIPRLPIKIYQFRCKLISTTKLVAWLPLTVLVFWIVMRVMMGF